MSDISMPGKEDWQLLYNRIRTGTFRQSIDRILLETPFQKLELHLKCTSGPSCSKLR